jgi:DNA-binding NtrC family response regulator
MEQLDIWYVCDNDHAGTVARAMVEMGFPLHVLDKKDYATAAVQMQASNIFIFDLEHTKPSDLMLMLRSDMRVQNFLKFAVLEEDMIEQAISAYPEALHLEFISRPVNRREFILLVEKSMIVEKYRELLKKYSREAENQIEEYESLLHIHKKDMFASDAEKNAFEKIIRHERNCWWSSKV